MLQAGLAEVMPVKNSEIETKQIMKRILSKTICTKIFDTLFPLYQTQVLIYYDISNFATSTVQERRSYFISKTQRTT